MAEPANGFRLKIYSFKKRRNSTKQPNDALTQDGGDLALSTFCAIKEPTNVYAPRLIIAVNHDSGTLVDGELTDAEVLRQTCNYAHFMGRFFWIEELICNSQDHWELVLQSDPLATYKTWIGDTKVFAEYWAGGNYEFIDTRLPRKTNGHSASISESLGLDSAWFFMIGVITNNGITYYKIGALALAQLLLNVQDNVDTILEQIKTLRPKDYSGTGSSSGDTGLDSLNVNNIANSITQNFEWFINSIALMLYNAMNNKSYAQYIVSLKFFPNSFPEINNATSVSENIYLGPFDTGANGERLLLYTPIEHEVIIDVPSNAVPEQTAWGRRDGLMNWSLYVPYVGTLNIPNDIIVGGTSKIMITYRLDLRTGDMFWKIGVKAFAAATSSITLASCTTAFGTDCLFGESHLNTAGMTLGAVAMAGGLLFSATSQAIGSAAASMGLYNIAGASRRENMMLGAQMNRSVTNSIKSGLAASGAGAMHFMHNISPTFNSIGGSGGVGLNPSNHTGMACLSWYSFDVSEKESNLAPLIGVPKFGITTVKSCGGYVKASGASVEIPTACPAEIDAINVALNNGMYYE